MPDIDYQVILHNANQLPEDRYVNTLYFNEPSQGTPDLTVTMDRIKAAYATNLGGLIGGQVNGLTIKTYAPGLNPGGPLVTKDYGFDPSAAGGPAEVALCLSYYAGQNSPSKRGRVYIGPFAASALGGERPSDGTITSLLNWAAAIKAAGAGSVSNWVQHSRKNGSYNAVTNWYVDNAWDTQRRRGAKPTGRATGS